MIKHKSLLLIFFLLVFNSGFSQDYKTGIGIRLGGLTSGLTVRGFTNSSTAMEGILGLAHRSFIITGLYEKFQPISNAEGLNWFYGGGAHIGFFQYGGYYYLYKEHGHVYYVDHEGDSRVIIGGDFIIGLDYKFRNVPLNAGIDLKPFIDFADGVQGYFDGALSFRFVF